jgi:hypothetical protein
MTPTPHRQFRLPTLPKLSERHEGLKIGLKEYFIEGMDPKWKKRQGFSEVVEGLGAK